MRQPGWRWVWAGRASLEDRPGSFLRVLAYASPVTGRTPVATWPGTCPSRTGRTPGIYCTGQRLLPDTHPIKCTGLPAQLPDASPLCCTPCRYMPGHTPRLHPAHSRYLCQLCWLGALPVLHAGRTPDCISRQANSHQQPMQLCAVYRGQALPAFGGNTSALDSNNT